MTDNYINRMIEGHGGAFDMIYNMYKSQFIALFRKNQGLSRDDAEELYHDVCAILINNVETGRLGVDSIKNSQLKAYLNNTGKYILFNRRRKRQVPLTVDTDFIMKGELNAISDGDEEYDKELDDKLFIIRSTVRDMPEPCSRILKLVVFNKKSNSEVARIMNYASADTVKTQRHRCMGKLREKVIRRFKSAGYEQ